MKRLIALILIPFICSQNAFAADNTFIDYQNYNHGYCSSCNYCPCRCDVQSCPNSEPCSKQPECPPPCDAPTPCSTPAAPAPCNPCDPTAPICGTECGISVCAIVVAIGALAAAAAIIIASSNGSATSH